MSTGGARIDTVSELDMRPEAARMDLSGNRRERTLYCPWHQGGVDAVKSGRPVWDGREAGAKARAGIICFLV